IPTEGDGCVEPELQPAPPTLALLPTVPTVEERLAIAERECTVLRTTCDALRTAHDTFHLEHASLRTSHDALRVGFDELQAALTTSLGRQHGAGSTAPGSPGLHSDCEASFSPCFCCYAEMVGEEEDARLHVGPLPCRVCGCLVGVPESELPFGKTAAREETNCSFDCGEELGQSGVEWCAGCGFPAHRACVQKWRRCKREMEEDEHIAHTDSANHHAAECSRCRCCFYTGEPGRPLTVQRELVFSPANSINNDDLRDFTRVAYARNLAAAFVRVALGLQNRWP
uniref:Phorbol-ester/DAG-type domain-containing protein n=1 Tax=Globodera pallida TaxID=36090 RepID=A0A183CNL7_GLOPA